MIRLLRLPLPCSKNALHIPIKCGRFTKLVRSKKARTIGEALVAAIWLQIGGKPSRPCFTRPVSMTWTITFPDRRPRDGQNYMEHLADCLEKAGVIENDRQIFEKHEWKHIDKDNPRVAIRIEEI
mgnify:CR=1 FL=1